MSLAKGYTANTMMWQQTYLGLLQRIDELKYQLPRSERRIAETVLENPEVVSYMRLNELAQASNVSIATVHRFCRSLGCEGFKELRQEISRSMSAVAAQPSPVELQGNPNDTLPTIIGEVNQSLLGLHTSLEEHSLTVASSLLNAATRTLIYTSDESYHSNAQEISSLLYKAGLPCEPQLSEQAMSRSVPTLKKNDLAIFIVSDRSLEPSAWMGPVKQLGGNSLSIEVGNKSAGQSADLTIPIRHLPGGQYSQLSAQIGLSVLFTHLSQSITRP